MTLKNFQILGTLPVDQLNAALADHPELWNQHNLRTTHPGTPHQAVSDILVRFNPPGGFNLDDTECTWYPASDVLPVAPILTAVLGVVKGDRLGRSVITRLTPGTGIEPHVDHGAPAHYYQRFHVALQNAPGATFYCGDEELTPEPGDVFIFNNALEHSVWNGSDSDRVTLIIDVRTSWFEHIKKTLKDPWLPPTYQATAGSYTFQCESFAAIIPELVPFAPIHWAELAVHQRDVPLNMDWDRFVSMENEGRLHTLTVRHDGQLVGYHISIVSGHLHYKDTPHALVDLYYLAKDHRKHGVGANLFKHVHNSLRQLGVVKIITGTKLHQDHGRLLEHLGYTQTDATYSRLLKE